MLFFNFSTIRVYSSVDDIDLWVGLLAENKADPKPDVIVGATLTCLFAKQFQDLKFGDRFFFENAPDVAKKTDKTAFSIGQLNELKKVSLSTLLCNNFDVSVIAPDVFFIDTPSRPKNTKNACSTFAQMDFTQWKSV